MTNGRDLRMKALLLSRRLGAWVSKGSRAWEHCPSSRSLDPLSSQAQSVQENYETNFWTVSATGADSATYRTTNRMPVVIPATHPATFSKSSVRSIFLYSMCFGGLAKVPGGFGGPKFGGRYPCTRSLELPCTQATYDANRLSVSNTWTQ